jgi:hypothetical protein
MLDAILNAIARLSFSYFNSFSCILCVLKFHIFLDVNLAYVDEVLRSIFGAHFSSRPPSLFAIYG